MNNQEKLDVICEHQKAIDFFLSKMSFIDDTLDKFDELEMNEPMVKDLLKGIKTGVELALNATKQKLQFFISEHTKSDTPVEEVKCTFCNEEKRKQLTEDIDSKKDLEVVSVCSDCVQRFITNYDNQPS